jgi:hypothetical protein
MRWVAPGQLVDIGVTGVRFGFPEDPAFGVP